MQRVVVIRGNWIELVIVAAGAGDAQSQQPSRDDVDAVIDDVLGFVAEASTNSQESHRRQRAVILPEVELIGGELFEDETIEREILVERVDDVIAIGIRKWVPPLFGEDIAFRVRIAGDIEPVPSP